MGYRRKSERIELLPRQHIKRADFPGTKHARKLLLPSNASQLGAVIRLPAHESQTRKGIR